MKIHTLTLMMAASAVVLTGCVNPDGTQNNTGSGALLGGALGALTGAAMGGHHHGGEGALLGAAVGAMAGGLVGNSMDQEQQARLRRQAPQTYERMEQGQPLSVADIKALAQAQIADDVIISQIRNSRTVYHLSAADIIDLHNSGVSDKIVDFMINTPTMLGERPGMTSALQASTVPAPEPPPPAPVETVVVAPGPDYVWVGGEWAWSGRWYWVSGRWCAPPHPQAIWVSGSWGRGPHGWHRYPGRWR